LARAVGNGVGNGIYNARGCVARIGHGVGNGTNNSVCAWNIGKGRRIECHASKAT
jgi:hypothetical protein